MSELHNPAASTVAARSSGPPLSTPPPPASPAPTALSARGSLDFDAQPRSPGPQAATAASAAALGADNPGPEPEIEQTLLEQAPPWLVSAIVHMVVLIVFGLWMFGGDSELPLVLDVTYGEELGEQLDEEELALTDNPLEEIEQILTPEDLMPTVDPLAAPEELPDSPLATAISTPLEAAQPGWALSGREQGMKQALLAAYGGTATTEAAVMEGLKWLARHQKKTGEWSLIGSYANGGNAENREAATAMALLAFLGAGYTHQGPASEPFTPVVSRGLNALLKRQDKDGNFFTSGMRHHRLYTQAQCTIALCELYTMTEDSALRDPAQRAVNYCVRAQSPRGGWRYDPASDADTSVTGWFVMALKSAQMAGLEVPSDALVRVEDYLDRAAHSDGKLYAYRPGEQPKISMTAEGLLCRQYLGWKRDDPRLVGGVQLLLVEPIDYASQDVYYWYYATQVCHHMEGQDWQEWNRIMRQAIPENQVKQAGSERGSWDPARDRWGIQGGRLYVTCLSLYMLEVYYRHMPIYRQDVLR